MRLALEPDLKAMRRHAAEAALMLKLLGHEARLSVLCELVMGERSVSALVATSGLSQSALSQHLARLRDEDLVATRRDAQTIYYRLKNKKAAQIIALLHSLYCKGT